MQTLTWRQLIVNLLESHTIGPSQLDLDQPARVSASDAPTIRIVTAVDPMFDGGLILRTAPEKVTQ